MDKSAGVMKGLESLENFERALGHIRNSARPLTLMSRDEVEACISPQDAAKHNLQLAYGMTSLFYMFLRTQGVAPANHPVKAELDRIRKYFARMKQVGKPPEQRKLKVDAAASRRFIDSALSGDNVWQSARGGAGRRHGREDGGGGIGRSTPAGQPQEHRYHDRDGRKGRAATASRGSSNEDDDGPSRQKVPGSLASPPSGSVKRKHLAKGSEDTNAAGSADKRIRHSEGGTKRGNSHEFGGSGGGKGPSAGPDHGGARTRKPGSGKSARGSEARGKPGGSARAPSSSKNEKGRRK